MKIFAVIRNYQPTVAREDPLMGCGEPDWYEMPDSSILRTGNPFFVPDFDNEFVAFPSLCLRIGRLGKSIAPRFAYRYFDSWTMAVAAVGANTLRARREAGQPWTKAVAFDRSCILGNLQPIDTLINNELSVIECGSYKSIYNITSLLRSPETVLSEISAENTMKNGDLILAGLYNEGIILKAGTHLEITTNKSLIKLIDINIK